MRTWFVLLLATLLPATAALASPTVTLEERAVVISGMTPTGRVAFFSMAFERVDFHGRLTRLDLLLADEDGDGAVRVELEGAVPKASLWLAVDLATGELDLALPAGSPFREVTFPTAGLGAQLRSFEDRRQLLDLFLVRPGTGAEAGAWGLSLADGGRGDGDGAQNRSIRADTLAFTPIDDSPLAPERLEPGDVLVGFDPFARELYATRLPGGGN